MRQKSAPSEQHTMTSDLISTQQAADRLGLTTSALHELRCRDDGLSIVQQGLVVGYRLEDGLLPLNYV